jgi:hypothetical protein
MELRENRKIIYGAQSLTGKILFSKNLEAKHSGTAFQNRTDVRFVHRHGLDDDCAIRMWTQGQMSHLPVEKHESIDQIPLQSEH